MAADPNRAAGTWVTQRSRRETLHVWILLAIFAAAMLGGGLAARVGWLSSREGASVGLGIVALALLSFRAAELRSRQALAWVLGSRAERDVGGDLNRLRVDGLLVMHDLEPDGRGNIDHVVCGQTGVFAVETKARRYEVRHLKQVKRQAYWVRTRTGVWCTPVICLATRDDTPHRREGVWIMGRPHLVEWVRAQRGRPVDPDQAREGLCA
ncbi:MAG: nuclease-related domain-containing protein [Gaiellaceae bacterium]